MTPLNLIQYWRDSLADGARSKLGSDRLDSAVQIPPEEASSGYLNPEKIAVLFENAKGDERQGEAERTEGEPLSVLLCLRLLRRKVKRGESQGKSLGAIWLPAELTPAGSLKPSSKLPWIPRDLLEPIHEAELTLGDVEALDNYLTRYPKPVNRQNPEAPPRWCDVWAYTEAMFQHVAGTSLEDFEAEEYQKLEFVYLLRETQDDQNIPPRHILKLYDHLLKGRTVPPLLERFMLLKRPPAHSFLTPKEEIATSARHVGQMSAEHALRPSQRRALYHLLAGRDDGILAVSGPPGTGKTTLLQSVIASLWVAAAVEGDEPPVIVAASSNNKAIANVIARLSAAAEDDTLLSGRWLPGVLSYGLSCQSSGKEEADAQTTDRYSGGFMLPNGENIEAKSYVGNAEAHFLAVSGAWAGRMFTNVKAATAALHEALVEVTGSIAQGSKVWLALEAVQDELEAKYRGDIAGAIDQMTRNLEAIEQERADLEKVYRAWVNFDDGVPWWFTLFGMLPPVKKRYARRNKRFFERYAFEVEAELSDPDSIEIFFEGCEVELSEKKKRWQDDRKQACADAVRLEQAKDEWSSWLDANQMPSESGYPLEKMDTWLRYTAFKLATHYWEGRWLLDMKAWLGRNPDANNRRDQNEAAQAARWRRYAKLAPCAISTLYMLPSFFCIQDRRGKCVSPLYDFIDLLIVDEAGQAAPDVAAASFALAERALVIGDVKQLEPVQKLSLEVDRGNINRQGLTFSALSEVGLAASDGNVMRVAQKANTFQSDGEVPSGLLLTEHFRCVPKVMAYFNELAYENRLSSHCTGSENHLLPSLGYAHISGESEKRSSSRVNESEAQVIVDWLVSRKEQLKAHYAHDALDLRKIVAIVTPFRPQANLIKQRLKQLNQRDLCDLTVGTVHVLQGDERPVVLFSSVYDTKDRPPYFFDEGVNMLNVAVSRAQHSFLVFGNMTVFRRPGTRPSSLLGRYLFSNEANELTDLHLPPRRTLRTRTRTTHMDTLEAHREALTGALYEAAQRVVITSPFLTEAAILADGLPALIEQAVQRGVMVTVYTDPQLNRKQGGRLKPSFLAAQDLLKTSGAEVTSVRAEHSKTLIIDHAVLIEGSFNWLSASRDGQYQRRERSLRYEGENVGELIQSILADTKRRVEV